MEDELIGQLDGILASSGRGVRSRRGAGTITAATAESRPPSDWPLWQRKVMAAIKSSDLKETVRIVYGEIHDGGIGYEGYNGKWSIHELGSIYRPKKRRGSRHENKDGLSVLPSKVPLAVWRLLLAKAEARKVEVDNLINGILSTYPERALAAGIDGKSRIDLLMNMVRDEETAIASWVKKMVGGVSSNMAIDIRHVCDCGNSVVVTLRGEEANVSIGTRYGRAPSDMEGLQLLCALVSTLDAIGKEVIDTLSAINFSQKGGGAPDNNEVEATSITKDITKDDD